MRDTIEKALPLVQQGLERIQDPKPHHIHELLAFVVLDLAYPGCEVALLERAIRKIDPALDYSQPGTLAEEFTRRIEEVGAQNLEDGAWFERNMQERQTDGRSEDDV